MFRKKSEIKPTYFAQCHGGKGTVTARHLFTRADSACGFNFMQDTIVPVGASIGPHRHIRNEEVYYLLEGEAVIIIDDIRYPMHPGDVTMVKDGQVHEFVNVGDIDVRIIVVEAGEPIESENIRRAK